MGYLPPSCVTAPRAAGCRSPVELDLTITGNPESSCSVASGRVAYCLGTASGSEGFDRASALRELVEEQGPGGAPVLGNVTRAGLPRLAGLLLRLAMH
jgi:hypothetical protein